MWLRWLLCVSLNSIPLEKNKNLKLFNKLSDKSKYCRWRIFVIQFLQMGLFDIIRIYVYRRNIKMRMPAAEKEKIISLTGPDPCVRPPVLLRNFHRKEIISGYINTQPPSHCGRGRSAAEIPEDNANEWIEMDVYEMNLPVRTPRHGYCPFGILKVLYFVNRNQHENVRRGSAAAAVDQ